MEAPAHIAERLRDRGWPGDLDPGAHRLGDPIKHGAQPVRKALFIIDPGQLGEALVIKPEHLGGR